MEEKAELYDYLLENNSELFEFMFAKMLDENKYDLANKMFNNGKIKYKFLKGGNIRLHNYNYGDFYYGDNIDFSGINSDIIVNLCEQEKPNIISYLINYGLIDIQFFDEYIDLVELICAKLDLSNNVREKLENDIGKDKIAKYKNMCIMELYVCLYDENEPLFDNNIFIHIIKSYLI